MNHRKKLVFGSALVATLAKVGGAQSSASPRNGKTSKCGPGRQLLVIGQRDHDLFYGRNSARIEASCRSPGDGRKGHPHEVLAVDEHRRGAIGGPYVVLFHVV